MSRIRRVSSQKEFERAIDDYITQGYKVKSRGENSAQVKEKDYGSLGMHVIIAVLTIWWTLGIGNLIYGAIKYSSADEVTLRIENDEDE